MNDLPRRQPLLNSGPDAALLGIAEQLSGRGLKVRKTRHGSEVVELMVTDPKRIENGRVVVGYEGWLTWEYDCLIESPAAAEKTTNLIVSLLAHAAPHSDAPGTGS
jgi:hypothetical protein